jgi:hypothetical protein
MTQLKNEKHIKQAAVKSPLYFRPYVSSLKSALFAEIDKQTKQPKSGENEEQIKDNDIESTTSYASSYASSINIILHKEKGSKTGVTLTSYEKIFTETERFRTPTKPIPIPRSRSNQSESFCHSIFQTPSPTKKTTPEKRKYEDDDLLPFSLPNSEKWDFLEFLRKMEEEAEAKASAGLNK